MTCCTGNAICTTLNESHNTSNHNIADYNQHQIRNQITDQSSNAKIVFSNDYQSDGQPTQYINGKSDIMADYNSGTFIGNDQVFPTRVINANNKKRSRGSDDDIESPVKKRRLNDNGEKKIKDNNAGKNEKSHDDMKSHQKNAESNDDEFIKKVVENNDDSKDELIMKSKDRKGYVTIYLCCYVQSVNK